ncbi:hypothetical protein CDAR_503501 [Caerostris darwini]|uniref:Uncharacterized protein n=1 Tax=Caerostris darwini TaxID=1538125 RepID=A0AAV4QHH1_9ARAC|nr:hypothetical protein CDAR_503501 [Caerostris darwini]
MQNTRMNEQILHVKHFFKIPLMPDFFHSINPAKSKTGFPDSFSISSAPQNKSIHAPNYHRNSEPPNLYGVSCSPTHFPRGLKDGASTQDS